MRTHYESQLQDKIRQKIRETKGVSILFVRPHFHVGIENSEVIHGPINTVVENLGNYVDVWIAEAVKEAESRLHKSYCDSGNKLASERDSLKKALEERNAEIAALKQKLATKWMLRGLIDGKPAYLIDIDEENGVPVWSCIARDRRKALRFRDKTLAETTARKVRAAVPGGGVVFLEETIEDQEPVPAPIAIKINGQENPAFPHVENKVVPGPVALKKGDPLRTAVEWVLSDASFKAPEQIGDVADRWVKRLEMALEEESSSTPEIVARVDYSELEMRVMGAAAKQKEKDVAFLEARSGVVLRPVTKQDEEEDPTRLCFYDPYSGVSREVTVTSKRGAKKLRSVVKLDRRWKPVVLGAEAKTAETKPVKTYVLRSVVKDSPLPLYFASLGGWVADVKYALKLPWTVAHSLAPGIYPPLGRPSTSVEVVYLPTIQEKP